MITINLNCQIDEVVKLIKRQDLLIIKKFGEVMTKVNELAVMLNEIAEGVDNIEADIMSLKDKLEGMELPLDAEEALQKVISRVSSVKDIIQ